MERKEKSEKPPALFDLTALQRAANRTLGYTAQQTLDYLQALYEKKLCTYPRTDSRYLTDDLAAAVPKLAAVSAALCGAALPEEVNAAQVCSNTKVSDHHAIIPTEGAGKADLSALPAGEREVLHLAARQLLCAVGQPHRFAETSGDGGVRRLHLFCQRENGAVDGLESLSRGRTERHLFVGAGRGGRPCRSRKRL